MEFATDRIVVGDAGAVENYHATHVAGTMAAKGVRADCIGMAPALVLTSFNWNDDLTKLRTIAPATQITNHSYGPSTGWDRRPGLAPGVNWIWWGDASTSVSEDAAFGKYSSENQALDEIWFENPHLLTVVAAGNDRDDAPLSQSVSHYVQGIDPATGNLEWFISGSTRNRAC